MKEIKAYIKSNKLSRVISALKEIDGLTGVTIFHGKGVGKAMGEKKLNSQQIAMEDYLPIVKLEIVCKDELAENIVNLIQKTVHTGLKGDGKIYISPIENAIKISTNERGEKAV